MRPHEIALPLILALEGCSAPAATPHAPKAPLAAHASSKELNEVKVRYLAAVARAEIIAALRLRLAMEKGPEAETEAYRRCTEKPDIKAKRTLSLGKLRAIKEVGEMMTAGKDLCSSRGGSRGDVYDSGDKLPKGVEGIVGATCMDGFIAEMAPPESAAQVAAYLRSANDVKGSVITCLHDALTVERLERDREE